MTAGFVSFFLLISSSDPNWAWIMIQRSFLVGGLMGLTNGFFAAWSSCISSNDNRADERLDAR